MHNISLVVAAHLMMDLFLYLSLKILKRSKNGEMVVVVACAGRGARQLSTTERLTG